MLFYSKKASKFLLRSHLTVLFQIMRKKNVSSVADSAHSHFADSPTELPRINNGQIIQLENYISQYVLNRYIHKREQKNGDLLQRKRTTVYY